MRPLYVCRHWSVINSCCLLILLCRYKMVTVAKTLTVEAEQLKPAEDVLSQGFELCCTCEATLTQCVCGHGSANNNSDRRPYGKQVGHHTGPDAVSASFLYACDGVGACCSITSVHFSSSFSPPSILSSFLSSSSPSCKASWARGQRYKTV